MCIYTNSLIQHESKHMSAQHTPGPWALEKHCGEWMVGPKEIWVCQLIEDGQDEREFQATARLIASAPDLLAALQAMTDAAGQWVGSSEQLQAAYLNARALVAKVDAQ